MPAPLPESIKVGPTVYTVQRQNMADRGQTDIDQSVITLADRLGPQQERATLVHEVLHAVYQATGQLIPNAENADDHAEQVICLWAEPLLGVLRDNPALVAYLTAT